jgi:predicted RNA binding protein with dsRBD fold (UPF0201 family)
MVQLTLTTEEAETLREVLDSYLSDLRMEIADTDAMEFREKLKEQEASLRKLLQRLEAKPVS